MATDDSPPRNKSIVIYGLVSVALLIALKLGLDWYFVHMTHAERARVVAMESAPSMRVAPVRTPAATKAHP